MVAELVEALLPRLEEHEGRVTAVFLKKGDLRILSDRALKNAFEVIAQGTRLETATLEIESIPVHVVCRSCAYDGPAQVLKDDTFHFAVPVLTCPACGADVAVKTGRELCVDRVSIETGSDGEA